MRSVHDYCLPQSVVLRLYESAQLNVDEQRLVELFGRPPYAFAGESTYATERDPASSPAIAPCKEFGRLSVKRSTLLRRLDGSGGSRQLPDWMRSILDDVQDVQFLVGAWVDDVGRHYKSESEQLEDPWHLSMKAIPRVCAEKFPTVGELLILRRELSTPIAGRVQEVVRHSRTSTAYVLLADIQK